MIGDMPSGRRALSGRQRAAVLVLAAVVGLGLGWLIASRNPLGHCAYSSIDTGTRLDCASIESHDGGRFLLITNEPGRAGDDIQTGEATSAVAATMSRLPAGYAGVCYERMGIDAVPVCTARPGGSSASGVLHLAPPEQAAQDAALIVAGLSLFCVCVAGLALVLWPSRAAAPV